MLLKVGDRLGPYEILAPLGAGGMGEVYRAHDSRLGRDVAIKVLPSAFSADPERLHRFEQEARAAAALNHPNILAVFDLGQHEGAPFIVSELLEGGTLRERLTEPLGRAEARPLHENGSGRASARPTPLPVRKAVEYAVQIAHGLAAAHDKGIVHRDLKPENVFVTSDGRVKILDFGLAKLTLAEPDGPAQAGHYVEGRSVRLQADLSAASTVPPNTAPGLILGTLGYMAPEQVRGLPADHRVDLFAFGVVLYEMLAGRGAFLRDTPADTMTAILKDDPPDLPADDRQIPPTLTRIVNRCLEKSPAGRFQSAGDLAFALEALSSQSGSAPAVTAAIPQPRAAGSRDRLAWTLVAILAVAALALGATMYFRRPPVAVEATRFFVTPPEGWSLAMQEQGGPAVGPLAVAPDGRQVAFVARNAAGGSLIWVRSLDTLDAKGLVGTEGGVSPFWSPDSRSIGFFADGKLRKIETSGGPPVTLCDAAPGISGAWSPAGVIVFSAAGGTVLQKVPASGGTPTAATVLEEGGSGHARPAFLPDGRHFLYRSVAGPSSVRGAVYVASLDSTEQTRLIDADSTNVVYSQRHMLFLRETTLMAQPFDPERLATAGEAFPVAEQIQSFGAPPFGFFSASDSGVLTYQTASAAGLPQLIWFDRAGRVLATVGMPAAYSDLALAPDGRRALVSLLDGAGSDLWLLDLGRDGLATRFTFDAAGNTSPVWSPDGARVIFTSNRNGNADLYRSASSGAGGQEAVPANDRTRYASSWSRDGRFLLFTRPGGDGRADPDIWVLPLSGDQKPLPFVRTAAFEVDGHFSPDGNWVAYQSNESGRNEVYVAPFSISDGLSGGKKQISAGGGSAPQWRPDGKEVFYVSPVPNARLMAAAVSAQGTAFNVGAVMPLFAVRPPVRPTPYYQVSPDGQRFLFNIAPAVEAAPTPITVVVNWTAGLKK